MATRAMESVQFQLGVLVQKDLWRDLMGCLLIPGFRLEVLPASPCVALAPGGLPGWTLPDHDILPWRLGQA